MFDGLINLKISEQNKEKLLEIKLNTLNKKESENIIKFDNYLFFKWIIKNNVNEEMIENYLKEFDLFKDLNYNIEWKNENLNLFIELPNKFNEVELKEVFNENFNLDLNLVIRNNLFNDELGILELLNNLELNLKFSLNSKILNIFENILSKFWPFEINLNFLKKLNLILELNKIDNFGLKYKDIIESLIYIIFFQIISINEMFIDFPKIQLIINNKILMNFEIFHKFQSFEDLSKELNNLLK